MIEISNFLGGITNSASSSIGLNSIFTSILKSAIVLALLVLLIIMFIYPCKKGTPAWVLLKVYLYVFAVSLFFFYVHNSINCSKYEEKHLDRNVDNFIENIGGHNIYHEDKMDVLPMMTPRRQEIHGASEYEDEEELSTDDMLKKLGV
jgi:hypothetical protein